MIFFSDLERLIMQSYTPTIRVRKVTPLYDIKDWLTPHMAGRFQNHSYPHWFKFGKNNGQTLMHYRNWIDQPWEPQPVFGSDGNTVERSDSLGLQCLQVIKVKSLSCVITCVPPLGRMLKRYKWFESLS